MSFPFELNPGPPFIFDDAGSGRPHLRSDRNSVRKLAEVVWFWYNRKASGPHPHLVFPAAHKLAPEFIAACWHAGVPFRMLPDYEEDTTESLNHITPVPYLWQQALKAYVDEFGTGFKPQERAIPEESYFAYVFTSGSSAGPKLIGLKRSQIQHAAAASAKNIRPAGDESWMLNLPLNHIGGISVVLRSWTYGCSVLDLRSASPENILLHFENNTAATMTSLVPTQLSRFMQFSDGFRLHKQFKAVLLGGGPSPAELISSCRRASIPVMKSYGMTESCAQVVSVPYSEINTAPASASGRLFEGHTLSIRNEDGRELKQGRSGVIWLKGPQLISSYINENAYSDAFDKDGYFCTGDYGFLDESGYLHIEMRRSDLIVTGGENVNPAEVEAAILKAWPGFKDCAVAGVNDEEWGQQVVAFIVADSKSERERPSLGIFRESLRNRLAAFKIPARIVFTDQLPRNEMGKLKRHLLKVE